MDEDELIDPPGTLDDATDIGDGSDLGDGGDEPAAPDFVLENRVEGAASYRMDGEAVVYLGEDGTEVGRYDPNPPAPRAPAAPPVPPVAPAPPAFVGQLLPSDLTPEETQYFNDLVAEGNAAQAIGYRDQTLAQRRQHNEQVITASQAPIAQAMPDVYARYGQRMRQQAMTLHPQIAATDRGGQAALGLAMINAAIEGGRSVVDEAIELVKAAGKWPAAAPAKPAARPAALPPAQRPPSVPAGGGSPPNGARRLPSAPVDRVTRMLQGATGGRTSGETARRTAKEIRES